jgi:hypothetical protein
MSVKALDHESYWTLSILAFIIPIVGLILGIVYLTKDNKLDKKLGEHLVALSVLFMIFWGVAYIFLIGSQINTAQSNYQQAINQAYGQ